MSRVVDVTRTHLVAWPTAVGWPFGILGIAFAMNLLVLGALGDGVEAGSSGGLLSIYIVFFVTYVQSVTQVFPFLSGLSVTRREFFAGTVLVVLLQAVLFAAFLVVLRVLEDVTGGWGLGVTFFGVPYLRHDHLLVQLAAYAVPFVALACLGIALGVVHKRWGTNGLLGLSVLVMVVAGGLVALVTWQRAWPSVGRWFTETSPLAMVAGWPLVVAVALAGAAYVLLRRAVP